MNMLPDLSATRLNGTLLVESANGLVTRMEPLKGDSYISRQVMHLDSAAKKLMELTGISLASEDTPLIREIDGEIDELIPELIDDLKSTSKKTKFFANRAESAAALLKLVNRRDLKKLVYGSYVDQGFEIRALLADVFTAANEEHLEVSETKQMFDLLKKRYTVLAQLLNARTNETNLPTSTREQRQIVRYRIEKILHYIDSNIFDGIAGFAAVKEPVTQLINEVTSKWKAEETRKANKNSGEIELEISAS